MSDPNDSMSQQSADQGKPPVPVSQYGIVALGAYLILFTLVIVCVLWYTVPACDVPLVVEHRPTALVVTSVTPTHALIGGGEQIRILGDRFKPGARVGIGTQGPTPALFVSPSELVLTTSKHDAGIVDVTVSQNGESDTLRSSLQFVTERPAAAATPSPTSIQISAVDPPSVRVSGGEEVTITGAGFTTGSTVRFGGAPARQVHVDGPHVITAVTPAHAAGPASVLVANDQFFNSLDGRFNFVCPAAPDRVMVLMVVLAGALGGLVHALRSFVWYVGERKLLWNWTPMYVLLPFATSALGLVFYLVIRAGLYQPSAGTSLLLVGLAAIVGMFSTQAVEKLKAIAEGLFTKAPQGANAAPPSAPANAPAPAITALKPASGPRAGGTLVTITGVGFAPQSTVRFGQTPSAQVTFVNASTLKAIAPAAATAGKVTLAVTPPGKPDIVKADAYSYAEPKGKITDLSPKEGVPAGGTSVTVKGEQFTPDVSVMFGEEPATPVKFVDATTLQVTTPGQSQAGAVDVRVDAGAGLIAVAPAAFIYKA